MRIPWNGKEWRRVAVYGLGISGRAAVELLRRRDVAVLALDRRRPDEVDLGDLASDPGVELYLGMEPRELPADIDGVVISPGVPPDRPLLQAARHQGLVVIAEVELAFPFLDGEVVGITGSNGKSTTTALTGAMLRAGGHRAEVCGNIGEALCSRVEGEPGRIFVVELSSFQLEGIRQFHPRSAALLNISHDHLDRHADLKSYQAAKAEIFARQEPADLAVLNACDPLVRSLPVPSRRRFFASRGEVADGCHLAGDAVVEVAPGAEPRELFRRSEVPLPGRHNLENAMAAALLACNHGVSPADIRDGLLGFQGLRHRLELVAERAGVAWYDDSKGTNVAATLRSLEGFADGAVHIILGGRTKGGDLSELRPVVARKARRAYLIGESAAAFARALDSAVPLESVGTLGRAVERAAESACSGEVVLLSPACASFDQFPNFAERGRIFQQLVRALPPSPSSGGDLGSQAGV